SVQGVRVSSPPDRTSTGRVGGTKGGCPEGSGEPQGGAPVDRVMGGSSRTGAGQWRQSSNSATGDVVHFSTARARTARVGVAGSSRAGAAQVTQSSNSATGEVVHSWTENGAKVSSERASTAAWYWAW